MQRPDYLLGTCRRYKSDTSILATWIAEQAHKHGYKIPLDDFEGVAKFITGLTKPKVSVPPTILRAARGAITARERCSAWFRKKSTNDEEVRKNNERHSRFIRVLERVMEILKPCYAEEPEPLMRPVMVGFRKPPRCFLF